MILTPYCSFIIVFTIQWLTAPQYSDSHFMVILLLRLLSYYLRLLSLVHKYSHLLYCSIKGVQTVVVRLKSKINLAGLITPFAHSSPLQRLWYHPIAPRSAPSDTYIFFISIPWTDHRCVRGIDPHPDYTTYPSVPSGPNVFPPGLNIQPECYIHAYPCPKFFRFDFSLVFQLRIKPKLVQYHYMDLTSIILRLFRSISLI